MNWEDLTNEERMKWDEITKKFQRELVIIQKLMSSTKCFMCKTKFPNGLIEKNFGYDKDKKPVYVSPKGDFAAHLYTTHGLPKDFLNLALNQNV